MDLSRLRALVRIAIAVLAASLLVGVGSTSAADVAALDGPTTQVLDTFNRPPESPVSQWGNWGLTGVNGGQSLQIRDGQLGEFNSNTSGSAFRVVENPGDMEAFFTITGPPSNLNSQLLYLSLRDVGTPGYDGYALAVSGTLSSTTRLRIARYTNGVPTDLVNPFPQVEISPGDKLLFRRNGSSLEGWLQHGDTWSLGIAASDGTYTGGRIGLAIADSGFGNGGGTVDDFGGTGSTTPQPPPLDVPLTGILDDFNRPPENPVFQDGNWAPTGIAGGTALRLTNSRLQTLDGNTSGSSYRVADFSGDAEAYFRIVAPPSSLNGMQVFIGLNDVGTTGVDGYGLRLARTTTTTRWNIFRYTNGSAVSLIDWVRDAASGHQMLLRRHGTKLEAWHQRGGTWFLEATVIDGTYMSGKIGVELSTSGFGGAPIADDFGGGTFGGVEPPPEDSIGKTFGNCGRGVHAYSRAACFDDPVNSLTGAFTTNAVDLRLPGIGVPFTWGRTYTSADPTVGRLGPGWTDSYAASLVVQGNGDVVLHGDDGQEVRYAKQPDGSFVGESGALSTLSSVTGGYELVRVDQVTYLFTAQGRLTSLKDRNDKGLTFAYDGSGLLQTITDSVGRQVGVQFQGALLSRVTLPDGRYIEYGYTDGRLTSVRDTRGGTTAYTYDAGGRLKTIVDPKGHTVVDNTYGADGRVVQQRDGRGHGGTFAWDEATQTSTYTDARGNAWKDVYVNNALAERVDPLGNRVRFEYDADLNLTKVTDARGNATTMTYDQRGNLLTRTAPAPLAHQQAWTYSARNDPLTYRDGRGSVTDFGYDAAGNLTSVTAPDADGPGPLGRPQTQYGRDAGTGLLVSLTDPRGKQTTFSYAGGNLTEVRTPLGNRTTMGYDGSGRLTSLVEPRGNASGGVPADFTWAYTYDAADQLLTQRDPLGNQTTLAYDAAGNLVSRTNAKLASTSWGHDEANNLTSVTAPDGAVTRYTYDQVGNVATRLDAKLHLTMYEYDAANRLTRMVTPDNRVWTHEYDADGNLTQTVDANGNATAEAGDGRTTYAYDVLSRLSAIDYSGPTSDVAFAYDPNGNRTQMTDGTGAETYAYDALDRLTNVTRGPDAFAYRYDLANLVETTYPDGTSVAYAHDDDERLLTVSSGGQTTTYAYDAAGNQTLTTLPSGNGYVETRVYDRTGRLTEVRNQRGSTTLSRFVATLDPVGNPTRIDRTGALAQTELYTYDAMDRLTSVCFASSCGAGSPDATTWTYDPVGNRLSSTVGGSPTVSYTYNDADELLTVAEGEGNEESESYRTQIVPGPKLIFRFAYDKAGNQISRLRYDKTGTQIQTTTTYAYDLANRLTTLSQSGQGTSETTSYSYDGDGKRLQASTGTSAGTTNLLWDVTQGLPQIALERDGSGGLLRRYVYGRQRISMTSGGSTSYYHYDRLGSAVNVTSSAGETRWTWAYEPFGATRTETSAAGTQPANPMKFTGEYRDPSALYHLRARQYDTSTGRFLSRDPLPSAPSKPMISRYAYADDRPTTLIDPSGLTPQTTACGFIKGTSAEGVPVGVAGAFTDFLSGLNAGAERTDELLPWDYLREGRAGERIVKFLGPTSLALAGLYEACAHRAQGATWWSAGGEAAFSTGGAFIGSSAGLALCVLVGVPAGPVGLACGVVGAVGGGYLGHRGGTLVWNEFPRL